MSERLVYIGGFGANEANVEYTANQIGQNIEGLDETWAYTWHQAVHNPECLEKAAKGAVLATHSLGASTLVAGFLFPNSTSHPALTAKEIILCQAPRVVRPSEYIQGFLGYGKAQEQQGLKPAINQIEQENPGIFAPDHMPWGLSEIFKQFISRKQIDRVKLARDMIDSRGNPYVSLMTSHFDQYYPPNFAEVLNATNRGVPVSTLDYTHDLIVDPAGMIDQHYGQIFPKGNRPDWYKKAA
jgi:hypothetical protein